MCNIKIVEVKSEEQRKIVSDKSFYSFYESPGTKDRLLKYRSYMKESFELILYEDDIPVSTVASIPMTQNIRGKLFKMAGIADVTTIPESRNKGHIKALMKKVFVNMKDQHQSISALYPFRESFYGKMGYSTLPQSRIAKFNPIVLNRINELNIQGSVKKYFLPNILDLYDEFLLKIQKQIHGFALLPRTARDYVKENPLWIAVAKCEDDIIGVLTYKLTGFEGKMQVNTFLYTNSRGKYLLLQWIAKHKDQVLEVLLPLNPNEFIENWLFDIRAKINSRSWVPSAMARIVVIENLRGINVGVGEIRIKITDDYCDWNNGYWKFKGENGKLIISKTNESDIELTIKGLSSIIFGSHNLNDLNFRNWGKLDNESIIILEKLFPNLYPFIYSTF